MNHFPETKVKFVLADKKVLRKVHVLNLDPYDNKQRHNITTFSVSNKVFVFPIHLLQAVSLNVVPPQRHIAAALGNKFVTVRNSNRVVVGGF